MHMTKRRQNDLISEKARRDLEASFTRDRIVGEFSKKVTNSITVKGEDGFWYKAFQAMDDFGNATLTYDPIPNGSIAGPLVILSYSDNIFGFALKAIGKGGKIVVKYGDDAIKH